MNGTLARFDTNSLSQLNRALIGFDRIFNDIENRYQNSYNNYPPYNIIQQDEDTYIVEIAVAGFEREDLTVEVNQDELIIKGQRIKEEDVSKYLHRGLAARNFERSFRLEAHMIVGDADLVNGVLRVTINRVIPESLKPRLITIK